VSNSSNTTGELNLTGNLTLGQTATTARNYFGTITGCATLTKGGGTWTQTLSGDNSAYTGDIVVNQGRLSVAHANALGTTAGDTTVASGAEVLFTGATLSIAEPLTIAGPGGADNGAIAAISTSTVTLSGAVTLSADATVTASSNSSLSFTNANSFTGTDTGLTVRGATPGSTIGGTISLGTGSLTKLESGKWTLSGANNYSGGTTISSGTIVLNNASGSGTGSGAVTVSAGTLQIGEGGTTGAVAGTITNDGTLTFNRTDAISYANITGTGTLNQNGSGTLELTGINTQSGGTNVNAGGLLLNGSLTTATVNVVLNAELGGSGTIIGDVNVLGTIAPGNSPGTLSISGDLTLAGLTEMVLEGTGLSQYDRILVGDVLTFGGDLNVGTNAFQPAPGQSFDLFDFVDGTDVGAFTNVFLPTLNAGTWDVSQLYNTGVISVLSDVVPVPLPGAVWGGIGLMSVVGVRRLRRRWAERA
jgi:fibronectin-binding autotransporter adhesin